MVILGIDPGSNCTGYGVLELDGKHFRYLTSGFFKLPIANFAQRLVSLYNKISEVVNLYRPDEVAVEEVFLARNVNSALKLGQARGVLILGASQQGAEVFEYAPRKVKQAVTGYGGAEKEQIQKMVATLLNISPFLQNDEADALAVAYCHTVWR